MNLQTQLYFQHYGPMYKPNNKWIAMHLCILVKPNFVMITGQGYLKLVAYEGDILTS